MDPDKEKKDLKKKKRIIIKPTKRFSLKMIYPITEYLHKIIAKTNPRPFLRRLQEITSTGRFLLKGERLLLYRMLPEELRSEVCHVRALRGRRGGVGPR